MLLSDGYILLSDGCILPPDGSKSSEFKVHVHPILHYFSAQIATGWVCIATRQLQVATGWLLFAPGQVLMSSF